jgi:hypothetical protein
MDETFEDKLDVLEKFLRKKLPECSFLLDTKHSPLSSVYRFVFTCEKRMARVEVTRAELEPANSSTLLHRLGKKWPPPEGEATYAIRLSRSGVDRLPWDSNDG